jgi:hypothetical protein
MVPSPRLGTRFQWPSLRATNGHGFARFHAATAVPPPENDGARDVRFGSLADMCDAKPNVRFTPIADIRLQHQRGNPHAFQIKLADI